MKIGKRRVVQSLGWYGLIAVLIAYILISMGYLSVESFVYLLLNFTGSFGIMISAWKNKDYPAMILNIFWGLVALIGIIRFIV